jgi:hypothetical protein
MMDDDAKIHTDYSCFVVLVMGIWVLVSLIGWMEDLGEVEK